ncbi:hypothetical protein AVEN_69036-1 [Araneus ventricosus]|uniref:Uncharacterized protein n=1 Tax=Araneus ventricosus TaxID=182803 RepID=A0A4Y2VCN5_ARAVE|nr:hypothetical protein AVEN_69036-1 [Araneus ventricosus]
MYGCVSQRKDVFREFSTVNLNLYAILDWNDSGGMEESFQQQEGHLTWLLSINENSILRKFSRGEGFEVNRRVGLRIFCHPHAQIWKRQRKETRFSVESTRINRCNFCNHQ